MGSSSVVKAVFFSTRSASRLASCSFLLPALLGSPNFMSLTDYFYHLNHNESDDDDWTPNSSHDEPSNHLITFLGSEDEDDELYSSDDNTDEAKTNAYLLDNITEQVNSITQYINNLMY